MKNLKESIAKVRKESSLNEGGTTSDVATWLEALDDVTDDLTNAAMGKNLTREFLALEQEEVLAVEEFVTAVDEAAQKLKRDLGPALRQKLVFRGRLY